MTNENDSVKSTSFDDETSDSSPRSNLRSTGVMASYGIGKFQRKAPPGMQSVTRCGLLRSLLNQWTNQRTKRLRLSGLSRSALTSGLMRPKLRIS